MDPIGLQAVLDFAYSGDTAACLDGGTVAQVRGAADALGVPRVQDLCAQEGQIQKKQQGEEEKGSRTHEGQSLLRGGAVGGGSGL